MDSALQVGSIISPLIAQNCAFSTPHDIFPLRIRGG